MKTVEPRSDVAIKFLKAMFPKGPWLLVSIDPEERANLHAQTFGPKTVKDCEAYLQLHNGKHNLYFHVNPVMAAMSKKARRENIKSMIQLHVDVDPRKPDPKFDDVERAAFLKEEQKRAFELLMSGRPKAVPEPTYVVYSGGGYQAFWSLKEPIPIDGDIEKAEEAKRYNQQLESIFKADHCHNIDRLMRLPGSINVPDAKKRSVGRVPALATVVFENTKNRYDISKFKKAVDPGVHGAGLKSEVDSVRIDTGNIERVSIDDLKASYEGIPPYILGIIVQGDEIDEARKQKKIDEGKDTSRSAYLFEVVCALVRAEVPDQTIYAIITDPTLGIGDAVLLTKNGKKLSAINAHNYAVRQIERAHEFTFNPALSEMNLKHAVIGNAGGRCEVIEEVWDPAMERHALTFQSFAAIRNRYDNQRVLIGKDAKGLDVFAPKGSWWLNQATRRQYDTITFSPTDEVKGAYNLWRGWAVQPLPGEKHDQFLDHIRENICDGNEEHSEYLLNWMARNVQFPASNGQVAVVLRGQRGTGKSQFAEHFGTLFGRHFLHTSESQHLVGHFNQHLRDCLLLFGDEAFFAGDKKHEGVLKTLVTEKHMMYEKKGQDPMPGPNYIRLILASNSDWVIPAGEHERRFFVLDCGTKRRQDNAYFKKLSEDMKDGGYESLLFYLLNRDIKGFEVRNFPRTEALRDQQRQSLNTDTDFWFQKLVEGRLFPEDAEWRLEVPIKSFYSEFRRAYRGVSRAEMMSERSFANLMAKKGLKKLGQAYNRPLSYRDHNGEDVTIDSPMMYEVPSLKDARAAWEKLLGEVDWGGVMKAKENAQEEEDLPGF